MMLPWVVAWTASLFLLSCLQISGTAPSGETLWTMSVPELPAPFSPNETQLPSPKNVHFKAILFCHILHWEPGQNQTQNIYYEVQYRRYGESWNPVPHCNRTPHLSCDLTLATLELDEQSYYARVRAITGHQTSNWTRTDSRLSKDDVILRIDQLKLQLSGNTVLLEILPARPPGATGNISYKNLFKHYREYDLSITKTLENREPIQISTKIYNETHNFSATEGEEVCIRAKPVIKSQPNEGIWSEPKCITIPQPDFTVTTISAFFASLLMVCLAVGYLGIQLYIRKPKKPPEVLASLAKQKSSGMLSKENFKVKQDIIHPLDEAAFPKVSLELKNSELHSSTDSGFSSTKQSLQNEDPQFLLPMLDPRIGGTQGASGPQQPKSSFSSGTSSSSSSTSSSSTSSSSTSTDSGVYSLSPQSGQEWKQQPGSRGPDREDSGIGLPQSSTLGSSQCLQHKRASTALEGTPLGSSTPKLTEEEAAASVVFQGYLQQSRCTDENQEGGPSLGEDPSLIGSPGYKCRTHRDVESGWPPLAQTKGYLKQSLPSRSLRVPGASPGQWIEPTEEWNLLSLVNTCELTFEHDNTPDLPLLNFSTAPTPPGIWNTDPITLPLISSLHTNE
ncbi:interleukin-10 receptor subunit alpha [Trichosurus vulpecula]|uniref:interleukin-10 receptor subunit alpha n=1 Tax=Trichosurus vulpecula TaxID=9337 RepID=UPI00186AEAA9|nr:interleukin-10 receptor subunit alpha [Trichosurus vulpecula]